MIKLHFQKILILISFVLFLIHNNTFCSTQIYQESDFYLASSNKPYILSDKKSKNYLLNNYDVSFYKLDLFVERNSTGVSGNVIIQAIVKSIVLDTFSFELEPYMLIDSIKINNENYTNYFNISSDYYISLYSPLSKNDTLTAQIFYHGTPPTSGYFSGISSQSSGQWNNEVTWTLSEPFNAKQWWPCKQDLNDKADSVHVFITTSSDNMAGSNGLLSAVVSLQDNKTRYEWKSNYPIAYYLISFSVAKYVDYSIYASPAGINDSILIQNFVYDNPACLDFYKTTIDHTKDIMELFSDLFTIYPFYKEKYGHCLAPMGGAMEHQTMSTMGYFSFRIIAHELAHQWWGNNVTCATWSDIWINEGFATYAEYLALQYLKNQSEADAVIQSIYNYTMTEPDGSIYIPPGEAITASRIFDGRLSYNKGAGILHMIRFELENDSLFFSVLKNFQNAFHNKTASGLDFKNVLENTSGIDFDDFFNQWYFGEGYPIYSVQWTQENDTLYFNSSQTTSSEITPLFNMLMEYKIKYIGGDTMIRVYQDANLCSYKIPVSHIVLDMEVDPNNWVINQLEDIIHGFDNKPNSFFSNFGPNPCVDELYIFFTKQKTFTISVFDITGAQVFNTKITSDHYILNTISLANGSYLLTVSDNKTSISRVFIKR